MSRTEAYKMSESTNLNLIPTDIVQLEEPNLEQMRVDRMSRNKTAMQAIDAGVTKTVLGTENGSLSEEDMAAIVLQAHYRGHLGRRVYLNLLFAQFEKEETTRQAKILEQVEEGQLLVDNHRLLVQLDEDNTTRRNKSRQKISHVITIQRAWRAYQRRHDKHNNLLHDTNSISSCDTSSTGNSMSVSPVESPSLRCPKDLETHPQSLTNTPTRSGLARNVGVVDSEPDSLVSDYSEMSEHVKEHLANVSVVPTGLVTDGEEFIELTEPVVVCNPPIREADETVEEYAKRVRKFNFLSLAQEFAALKKIEADASPFDVHLGMYGRGEDGESESSDASSLSPVEHLPPATINSQVDGNQNKVGRSADGVPDNGGDFDVYNMESTLPQMDWASLEQSLQQAAQQNQKQGSRHNDREEIRRRLAMASEEEYYGPERAFKKPNFQTRLQGGMKLQMCYLNEASSDTRELDTTKEESNAPNPAHSNNKPLLPSQTPAPQTNPPEPVVNTTAAKTSSEDGDFFSKQARLQAEARIALAQARPMAHMQLEVERQLRKKSPIAQIVGIPGIGDGKKCRLGRMTLSHMNLAQLQVVVNDLHAQIEAYNEELVHLLVERDDLHMEQDSKLVDIEDFTRRAQEVSARLNNSNHKKKDKRK